MIHLTPEQSEALTSIIKFLSSPNHIFILKGYAGAGKTTLLNALIHSLKTVAPTRHYMVFAPTGRAAKILRQKTGKGETIHKGIYIKHADNLIYEKNEDTQEEEVKEEQETKLIFDLRTPDVSNPIIIIDESSMISSKTSHDPQFQFGSDNLLEDLMEFANLHKGGKLIFVGDDAQLPPVGESQSNALSEEYFNQKGFSVQTAALTRVLRQGNGSLILENATSLRKTLFDKTPFHSFKYAEGEFSKTDSNLIASKYLQEGDDTIIITPRNEFALHYNQKIRAECFSRADAPVPGDRLLITRNAYNIPVKNETQPNAPANEVDLFNGEFCEILAVGEEEARAAFVGKERVTLKFRDVTIRHETGMELTVKIHSSLLDSPLPSLNELESKALFSDFIARFPNLRKKNLKNELLRKLRADSYFNALHVKYGYAITCHKAQGGEWENVFVDLKGRHGHTPDELRWKYTALTRAKNHLITMNDIHASYLSKLEIKPFTVVSTIDTASVPQLEIPETTPYHTQEDANYLRLKYTKVCQVLTPNETIDEISKHSWRESYYIKIGDATHRYDTTYNKKGEFKPFKLQSSPTPEAEALLQRLNTPPKINSNINYTPSTPLFIDLEKVIRKYAAQLNIQLTNIVESKEHYYVNYYFLAQHPCKIQFYFNDNGDLTTAQPFTTVVPPDPVFETLLNAIKSND